MSNPVIENWLLQDDFEILLRRQGWHLTGCKSIHDDPDVLMVRNPLSPLYIGRCPPVWHEFIGRNTVRKLLRALISRPRTREELVRICQDEQKLDWYLRLLEQGELIEHTADRWQRGPGCGSVDNMGSTLEWYVAEWYRSTLHSPARHGVLIKEVPQGGDLDVVALVDGSRVMVECKTSKPSDVSETELRWFLQRAADFNPEIAVLLIDTESSVTGVLDRLNTIYLDLSWKSARLENPNLSGDARLRVASFEEQAGFPGLYWGARHVYVTSTCVSIDASLSAVQRLYSSRIRHYSFLSGGDEIWDFVHGTVRRTKG